MLNADDLLAGSASLTEVEIPARLLGAAAGDDRRISLRPLTVQDLRLISRASRDSDELTAALMVQRALAEPELTIQQVAAMSAGLLQYLLQHVNRISGIHVSDEQLADAMQDPLTQASFELAREFGWTPDEIGGLTMGQVLLHLQMLRAQSRPQTYRN
jgi:hypothetical protein